MAGIPFDESSLFTQYMDQGKAFGHTGTQLQEFVEKRLNLARDRHDRHVEREQALEKEKISLDKAKLESDAKIEQEKLKVEQERIKSEALLAKEKEETRRIEIESAAGGSGFGSLGGQRRQNLKLAKIPNFNEKKDDIDAYLYRFEYTASAQGYNRELWPVVLSAHLDGAALSVFHSLASDENLSYDVLKENLCKKFRCTAEGYRKRFRESKPGSDESFDMYSMELRKLLDRWLALGEVDKTFEGVLDLILTEQLMQSVCKDLKVFLMEKNLSSFQHIVGAAEAYRVAHPEKIMAKKADGSSLFTSVAAQESDVEEDECAAFSGYYHEDRSRPRARFPTWRGQRGGRNVRRFRFSRDSRGRGHDYSDYGYRDARSPVSPGDRNFVDRRYGRQDSGDQQGSSSSSSNPCLLCRRPGHIVNACKFGASHENAKFCRLCGLVHAFGFCPQRRYQSAMSCQQDTSSEVTACNLPCESLLDIAGSEQTVCSSIQEFAGQLDLKSGFVNGTPCSVLRDTGATVCGVRKRLVHADQYTGETVRCVSFGGRVDKFPLAKVDVCSDFVSGEIVCCVLDAPVADFIVGNVPQVCVDVFSDGVSLESVAAVTRARSKHVLEKKRLQDLPEVLNVTPGDLAKKQKDDVSLSKCFEMASSGEVRSAGDASFYFHVSDDILYRVFKKGHRTWEQVVVPKGLRSYVLSVSHDTVLAGHCGARRTLVRLREKFDWPGVTVDVAKYVSSCDACQRAVSKGRVPPVPLAPVPIIGTPFHRVAIDLVGPISPPSEKGHRYILTVIDVATRYPEAVPMKDITSTDVAEALLTVFSRVGFPAQILSDQGPQFDSHLMKEFVNLCGSRGVRTSPYHPQANGIIERFHSTIKAMLRKVASDRPRDWDRFLPSLLFACRELPSETTGFSPFQLLFGREVRGPVALLQEVWTDREHSDDDAKPVYSYVFELQNRLADVAKIAMENTFQSSQKSKRLFDRKARQRSFKKGDEVLVLLPSSSNKLLAKWLGPFPITQDLHPDYRVLIKGKEKVLHANMLKKYIRRQTLSTSVHVECDQSGAAGAVESVSIVSDDPSDQWFDVGPVEFEPVCRKVRGGSVDGSVKYVELVACSVGVVDDSDGSTELPTLSTPMTTSTPDESLKDVKFDDKLSRDQREQIETVFARYEDILTTKPGCFSGDLFLEIPLTTDVPVKRRMYDIPFTAKEVVEREVQTMLDLGVIERSTSPYSAPVVLVKKKDGSCRFCIDYRWLNKVTVQDAEPIPDVEALFSVLGDAMFFTRIDLAKGYWQVPVLPVDRPKTAFASHVGLFQFVRMPFGLVSAPAVFARMMRMLHLERVSAINFFDDVLVHSVSWEQHLDHVEAVLHSLKQKGLTVRPSKIESGFRSLEFLGHVVGQGQLKPEAGKIMKIMQIPTPTTKKQVRSLLGLLSFYRRYVPNFASLSAPLSDLTKDGPRKARSIDWTPACARALQRIQEVLSSGPVLMLPRLDEQFVLRTDASSVGVGAVLLQENEGVLHPIVFASRKLLDREKNYSTIERECLAIVWAVHKLLKFLWGVKFVLQTDHRPLTYLRSCTFKNARIFRWALSLQEFSFEVKPISGTSNVLADLLSRSEMDQTVP